MAGTLPQTRLLAVKNDIVVGSFDGYLEAVQAVVKLHVIKDPENDKYTVFVNDKEEHPTYGIDWANEYEVARDWCKCFHHRLPRSIQFYRYLTR